MEDRLTPGAVAGLTGGLIQIIFGSVIKGFHISPYVFTDFARILILGKPYQGVLAFIVGVVCHLIMATMFGIILSYVIKYTTKRFYMLKGLCVGLVAFTFAGGSGTFYKMPVFTALPPLSAIVIIVGSSIYGLTTALTLKLVTDNFSRFFTDNTVKTENKKPPMKYHLAPSPARKIKEGKTVRLVKRIKHK